MFFSRNDVILLTGFFQNYEDTCQKAYGYISLSSYSTPSFTWKAGFKLIGVKLDYKTDDKLRFLLEKNMRERPSSCMGNRHLKRGERNKVFEDMTNSNGWSMSHYLPNGDFLEPNPSNEISLIKSFLKTPDNDELGFLKECKLEYPSSIHEKTKKNSFLPQKITSKVEYFSTFTMKEEGKNINLQIN